eukprot:scaffold10294_cov102-Skeletonema_dohrnii-CCMP3373.AAC.3
MLQATAGKLQLRSEVMALPDGVFRFSGGHQRSVYGVSLGSTKYHHENSMQFWGLRSECL